MGHDHNHSHSHSPGHQHGPANYGKAFAIGIALNVIFVAVEIIYGLQASSSALLADAGHNASDVLSLVFAWVASVLAEKRPSGRYTYGLRRTTILVSILNAMLLFGAVAMIGVDAVEKLQNPTAVVGNTIMWVAGVGVLINTITALLFMKGQKSDLNIKGAFLHMAADAAVSLGVVIAGFIIIQTNLTWIDPAISLAIMAVIVYSTWGLFTDSINLALDAVPKNINLSEVREDLLEIEGVVDVHDLHIWAISTTQTALTCHLVVPSETGDTFIEKVRSRLHADFGIDHTTIQIEKSQVYGDLHNHKGCTLEPKR